MTPGATARALGRTSWLTALVVVLTLLCVGTATAAATRPWSPVALPWGASWPVNDVYAFGATSLAAAGDGGHIGITSDGGRSWSVVVPEGLEAAAFTTIAVDSSGHGVVASGGLLLVTDDGGRTWRPPSYVGPGPGAAFNDVALHDSQAVAVGDSGVIMRSSDAGATWRKLASPTLSSLTSVAIAGDGTAVAGSAAGEILVGVADAWALAGAVEGIVSSVAASTDPVWGDGRPDLFAATGSDVLGSDDALTFASLPGLPDLTSQPWPSLAWAGAPERCLLIAGAGNAGFFEPLGQNWLPGSTGLGGTSRAVAPGGQSVAYLLATDGRLVRTLSAGREPATVELTKKRIVAGETTRLAATVSVDAPGSVLLRQRVPGRPWETARTASWASGDWKRSLSFLLDPSLTHEYLLEFKYGEDTVELAPLAEVVVVPKLGTTRSRLELRVGDVYRFSGSVTPKLAGETVGLLTDRGGSWRPVSLQGSVKLKDGRTWSSRPFGTPKAETYRLRAHLPGTRAHAEAWSRTLTVTIR
ncbi:MAG: YCF48-related protein [Actinobacteria bacterium]|nr:YCF48-related protein [Actinomycetota bacterium]